MSPFSHAMMLSGASIPESLRAMIPLAIAGAMNWRILRPTAVVINSASLIFSTTASVDESTAETPEMRISSLSTSLMCTVYCPSALILSTISLLTSANTT